jgi:hypothetical protein
MWISDLNMQRIQNGKLQQNCAEVVCKVLLTKIKILGAFADFAIFYRLVPSKFTKLKERNVISVISHRISRLNPLLSHIIS